MLRLFAIATVLTSIGALSAGGPTVDKSKLIGAWELVKGPAATLQFTGDKMLIRTKSGAES